MIFSKHRRVEARRRFGGREFQAKIKKAKSYKRAYQPIDLNRKSLWLIITGLKSNFFRVLWVAVIIVLVYFFVFSKALVISKVTVSGNQRLSSGQVTDVVSGLGSSRVFFVPKSNFFLLTKNQMDDTLRQALPYVKEIKNYKRSWPNKVAFEVVERDPGFIVTVGEKKYLVDDEGVVISNSPPETGLPVVTDQVNETFDIGAPLDNTKLVAFIISINKQWGTKVNTPIKEIKIPGKASAEVQIVSEEGWGVFFDVARNANLQLGNLSLILSREILAKDRANLSYIDLRLAKWAYYCYKNTPCVAGAEIDNTQAEQIIQPANAPVPAKETK